MRVGVVSAPRVIRRNVVRIVSVVVVVVVVALSAATSPTGPTAASPSAGQTRPQLSGPEKTYGTSHFVIHYTVTGADGVPNTDRDGNGTPDWVEDVGRAMEEIWSAEIYRMGWPEPVPDQGEGGDTRFDVYLMELFSQNLGGYVSPDGGYVGDNPATPQTETNAAYGYLVLDNDYVDPSPPAGLKVWPPGEWMRIIAAHEFNHVLQIGLNGNHEMRWWYEATANWAETQVFPNLRDNLQSAGAVFKSPDTCIMRYGGVQRVESGLHWYGMWVFNQSLTEQFGSGIIRDIWMAIGNSADYGPFDATFASYGTTFQDEIRRLAINVLLRNFVDGSSYPTARLQEAVNTPGEWTPADGVQRYAMDYIGLDFERGTYAVSTSAEDPGIESIVVGLKGQTADIYPPGRDVVVDFGRYDRAYLVVLNLTRPPNEAGCATARYTYRVQPSENAPAGPQYTLNAQHFTAPRVEAVTDPEDAPILDPYYQTEYDIDDEIATVDLPFQPITPKGEPAGYELDSVYGLNADEQGAEFVAYNAPSGGVVAQMLYYNQAGSLIRITQSPATFLTIGDWLAENRLEFKPGVEIWTVGNVDSAVVQREGRTLIVFMVRNRFFAIDGDAPRDVMLDMAARFAASTDW